MESLLEVKDLSVRFETDRGFAYAVRDVSFSVRSGDTLAVVGESGCGKSVTAKAVLGLHDKRTTRVSGIASFKGTDLLSLPERELRSIRGSAVSMIFQDPMTSLNPLMRVGDQVGEVFRLRRSMSREGARSAVLELFGRVGIADPERRFVQYPHEFSGGMLQRIMILIAAASEPELLIADEPTTALDVTVQAQILELVDRLKGEMGMSVLLITHDMGVVAERSSRIAVMYAGRIVESGPTASVLARPLHPYTEGLLDAVPRPGTRGTRLRTIEGSPPGLFTQTAPCAFAPRCRYRKPECDAARPPLREIEPGHEVACHFAPNLGLKGAS